MPILALVTGAVVVGLVGLLGVFVLWNMFTGRIDLRYVIADEDGYASLSRFQFLIFTFVISMCLLVITLESGEFPKLSVEVMGLLGISGGSYVISKGIQKSDGKGDADKADNKNLEGNKADDRRQDGA